MAAYLSSSKRFFYDSTSNSLPLSTTFLFFASSSALRRRSSYSYLRSKALWSTSSFILALFLIFLARVANLRVLKLSLKASLEGEIIAIMVVLQLPPRLSSKIRVTLESLYGMWERPLGAVSAVMTLPSVERDLLILLLSSRRLPVAPVTFTRSLPAKSTRLSLPTLTYFLCTFSGSIFYRIYSTIMMKMACERLLTSFILVLAWALAC